MLIPNLPHAKLYFLFSSFKIEKQNGRQKADKVTIIMIIRRGFEEFHVQRPGLLSRN